MEKLEKIDSIINRGLQRIFGARENGDHKVWFHSQCLNEDSNRLRKMGLREQDFPVHGRCWLHWGKGNNMEFCWDLLSDRFGIGLSTSYCEHHLTGHVQVPPLSLFLSVEADWAHAIHSWISDRNKEQGRQFGPGRWEVFGFRIHDDSIWFDLWHDGDEWRSSDPKWKRFSLNVPDFILGSRKYTSEVVSEHDVLIPMPEGAYPAHVKLTRDSWKRARWPRPLVLRRYDVELKIPIPFQGKGENSYDCGEDAIYSQHGCGEKLEDAIAGVVESVLRNRRRYDGNVLAKYPPPEERAKKMAEEAAKRAKNSAPQGVVSA